MPSQPHSMFPAAMPSAGPIRWALLRAHALIGTRPHLDKPEPPPSPKSSLERLAGAARNEGLDARTFASSTLDVVSTLDRSRPVVTVSKSGGLCLIAERRGSRVRIERENDVREWVETWQLGEALGDLNSNVERDWLSISASDAGFPPVAPGGRSPWRSAADLLSGESKNVIAILVYAVGVGLVSLALPLAVQALVNTVAFGQLVQPLVVLTILLAAGLILGATLRALQAWLVEIVQRRVFIRLVSALGERVPAAHLETFATGRGPELLNRFFDVFTAQKSLASLLVGGVEASLTALVGLLVLSFYHPALLAFGIVLLTLVVVVFGVLGRGATSLRPNSPWPAGSKRWLAIRSR